MLEREPRVGFEQLSGGDEMRADGFRIQFGKATQLSSDSRVE